MDTAGTISISIGDARFSTCLVLPRSHELVRHIQSLLPANTPLLQDHDLSAPSPASDHHQSRTARDHSYPAQRHRASPQSMSPSLPTYEDRHRSAEVIQALLDRPSSPPGTDTGGRPYTRSQGGSSRKKRCRVEDCGKISVSHGLCRAHGGGRRCHVDGCTKGAQSRGDYCWSHGGGHRCEVPGCMRTRKTKRFCNTHLHCGSDATQSFPRRVQAPVLARETVAPRETLSPTRPAVDYTGTARLPSLNQALHSYPHEPAPLLAFLSDRQRTSPGFSC